ncbi:carboxylesterase family protein [Aquimarina algicola]|uniref:Phospholipase/carboxylesterase/thioesterase domain-containing protein n=1 Tax=Aquimarina algicola TaxID=2589995 RepID=A0A504J1D7_9FLAO|nr:prolyl oligopeptidase family serine peptidase [Aquimarina algicola]TPN82282.1 hypothetical protein FHK87_22930 [Aquimarina algicola]
MKLRHILYFFVIISMIGCQKEEPSGISFLEKKPIIDGVLDKELTDLKEFEFNHIWQFDNPVTDTVPVTYRMGYTSTHLYVYIEAKSDSINYRKRGFVNGDGFKLLLAKPQLDSLTDEYYDMVFSASKDKEYWARKRIWEYNRAQGSNKKFSKNTLFEEKASNGKSGFEALISWKDIDPYHPWFMEKIGYNLYFAKAIQDTITNGYAVVEDEAIWDEEIPKRNYKLLSFDLPTTITNELVLFRCKNRNIIKQDTLWIEQVTKADDKYSKEIGLKIFDPQNQQVFKLKKNLKLTDQFLKDKFQVTTSSLDEGIYQMVIMSKNDTLLKSSITIFPKIDFKNINKKIKQNTTKLNQGIANTLLFKFQQLENQIRDLKYYESGQQYYKLYTTIKKEYLDFLNGKNPFLNIEKPYRRAFQSKSDNSYQPYTIKLPKEYDSNKKYPLLVFLHGSGADDVGLLNSPRSNGEFIEIAPFARDKYRAYTSDISQRDIIDAIEDVSTYFSIDKQNIIVGGFSMGGYGALRTFYEYPNLYKGVAVFAGHPNLANYWLKGNHPNFLDSKYLEVFQDKPVFVYHGKKDGSLPVHLIENMIAKMEKAGIDVTHRIVKEYGHQYPDQQTNNLYFEWLKNTISSQ